MSAKFTVRLTSALANHPLPPKTLLVQAPGEPLARVLLKLLAFVLFQRERLQLEPRLHDDDIPFIPGLVQLDYELRPALWIECGATPAERLDKLAVKAARSEIWVVLRSLVEMEQQLGEMHRLGLRERRYRLLGFEAAVFDELLALLTDRNELSLYRLDWSERQVQLDFNGIWFEGALEVREF